MKKLLTLVLALLLIVGCSSTSSNPKDVAEDFLDALSKGDLVKAQELTAPSQRDDDYDQGEIAGFDFDDDQMAKEFSQKLFKDGFVVGDVVEEGDTAFANITFTAPVMGQLMTSIFTISLQKAFDEEFNQLSETEQEAELNRLFIEELDNTDYESYESKVYLIKENDKWYAESLDGKNDSIIKPMMGGVGDIFDIED